MKHKKIIIATLFCLIVIAIIITIWLRYVQIRPISKNTKPNTITSKTTYTDKELASKTSEQSTTVDDIEETVINVPRTETTISPLTPTTKSKKQNEIRQSTPKENIYYPLLTANDPGYANNWAIQKVNAPAAWDISTGNNQTVIAIIDTGFALNHDDLKNNWLINTNETGNTKVGDLCWTGTTKDKSVNNCDDDNNGYMDDWRGWNFSIGDNDPSAGRTNINGEGVAHGTETAGLAGASGNNNTGITTINWNTKIMPLQALSDDGPGYTSDIVAAIYYAVDNGADVINMSLGGNESDPELETATNYAFSHNVVVVAAAGNCGSGTEQGCLNLPAGAMGYPALNDHVISVGATTSEDQRASFSSYGPDLDVVAPGSGTINSPTWTSSNSTSLYTASLYGTSFASPQVASLVSLIKSIRPNSSVNDITALISATTTKLPAMNGITYTNELGHGIINANMALTVATALNSTTESPILLQTGGAISEHRYTSSDSLGSGCNLTGGNYCAIWLRDDHNERNRYLPYKQSNQQNLAGWTWNGTIIPDGYWQIKAIQGDYESSPYYIGTK
ncbi:MAG: serine protease [Patescibacteria group bacterium]|nr:serine protease [Patescibacteria group bacterium]